MMKRLKTSPLSEQENRWPMRGRHILAQYDETSIIVYQAYRVAIADFAVANGRFGGDFSYSRMSWIKPNFLWMMYRCGWCSKEGQERVLAVRLPLGFFDWLLLQAVAATYDESRFPSGECWQKAVRGSCVRLQWDPDHGPDGSARERRALQLGLRGEALRRYGQEEVMEILDVTEFALEQRAKRDAGDALLTPEEMVYKPREESIRSRIGIDEGNELPTRAYT
jgi:hypothetical protein